MTGKLDTISDGAIGHTLANAAVVAVFTAAFVQAYSFGLSDAFLAALPTGMVLPFAEKYPFGLLDGASTERKILAYLAPWSAFGAVFVLTTSQGMGETPTPGQAATMLVFVAGMGAVYLSRTINTGVDGVMAGLKVTGLSFWVGVVLMEIATRAGTVTVTPAGQVETTALGAVVVGFALTTVLGVIATLLAGALVGVSRYRNRTAPSDVLEQEASN